MLGVGEGEEGGGVVKYRVKGMLEKAVGGVSWAVRQKRKAQMHMLLRSQSQQDSGRGGVTAAAAAGGGGGNMQGSGFTPVSGLAAAAAARAGESTGCRVGLEERSCSSNSSYNNSLSSFCFWEEFHGCGHVGGLWAMYLQWAGLRGGGMEAARKVFFRGLHACPGDKGLWLEGLGGAVRDLGSGEAQGLMAALEEMLGVSNAACECTLLPIPPSMIAMFGRLQ
jgi:hypothetical protein